MTKTKLIDAHGQALDLLREERNLLESALRDIKPKIDDLNRCHQAGDTLGYSLRMHLWGGSHSKLVKLRNDLQRRLNNVEATRRLLKADRAEQQQDAWDHEKWVEAVTASKPVLPCGCW